MLWQSWNRDENPRIRGEARETRLGGGTEPDAVAGGGRGGGARDRAASRRRATDRGLCFAAVTGAAGGRSSFAVAARSAHGTDPASFARGSARRPLVLLGPRLRERVADPPLAP